MLTMSRARWRRAAAITVAAAALLCPAVSNASSGGVNPSGGVSPAGAEADETGVFPISGKHSYGDGLGAGRGHQGQDLLAKCG